MTKQILSGLKVGGSALLVVGAVALLAEHRAAAAEDPPRTARYYRQQAAAACKAKDYVSAIGHLKKALDLIPDHPTLFYNIAFTKVRCSRKKRSIRC